MNCLNRLLFSFFLVKTLIGRYLAAGVKIIARHGPCLLRFNIRFPRALAIFAGYKMSLFTDIFFHLHYKTVNRRLKTISGNVVVFARKLPLITLDYIIMQIINVICGRTIVCCVGIEKVKK